MHLNPEETVLLRREILTSEQALAAARDTDDPLLALTELTAAIEALTATQHELVNTLLDRGSSFSTLATALSTSSAAARRRYPRRGSEPDPAAAPASPEAHDRPPAGDYAEPSGQPSSGR